MNINVISIFPEILESSFKGLTGKAIEKNIANLKSIDLKEFSKISFLARGNDEKYYFHIKSRGQVLPWVRHLKEFKVGKDWKEYVLNIEDFVGYSNSRTFNKSINPKKIKLLGIEAYGRDHEVELDIAKIKIF